MKQNNNTSKKKIEPKQPVVVISEKESNFFMKFFNNMSYEDKLCYFIMFVLMVIVVIIRSNFLSIPFERDEGIYSYYGILLSEGKIPYKDFYEQKFPGLFYLYDFVVTIFGNTVEGMHRGFMIINLLTIGFIFAAGKKLFNPIAGLISAISFAFLSLTPQLSGFTVQSEHGVALMISVGLYFYAVSKNNDKWYYYFLTGIAMGCAFMVKTTGVFLVVCGGIVVISDFIFNGKHDWKKFILQIASYSGGVILIIAWVFLIILMKGSFKEMIFWTFEIPKKYVSNMPFSQGFQYFKYNYGMMYEQHKFFWIHAFLALILCLLKTIDFKTKVLIFSVFIFSVFTIVPGYYFYGHYFIQTLPGISLISGFSFYAIYSYINTKFSLKINSFKYGYLGVFLIFTAVHFFSMKSYYMNPDYEEILRTVYGNNPFPEAMEIGNYINANSKPEDKIMIFGSEPEIYFYTKKKSVSRHAYFSAIVAAVPEHHQWQREFVSDVEKAKPRYIIVFHHPISILAMPNTDQYVFEWANKYMTENYNLVGMVDMIDGQTSKYLWKPQFEHYTPVSKNLIYILERK